MASSRAEAESLAACPEASFNGLTRWPTDLRSGHLWAAFVAEIWQAPSVLNVGRHQQHWGNLMLQFRGSAITSDAGLLAYRELDDTLGLTDTGADTLADARTGKNGRHRLAGLLRSRSSDACRL
jgi:hypothetical protein